MLIQKSLNEYWKYSIAWSAPVEDTITALIYHQMWKQI